MNPALARSGEGAQRFEGILIEVFAIVAELKHIAHDSCGGPRCPCIVRVLDKLRQDEARSLDLGKQYVPRPCTLGIRLEPLPPVPGLVGNGLEERWRLTH